MDDAAALDMVRTMLTQAEIGRLASVGASGQPTVAPFWFFFDGIRIVIRMPENATVRNVRARPAVAFQVDFGHRYADLPGGGRPRVRASLPTGGGAPEVRAALRATTGSTPSTGWRPARSATVTARSRAVPPSRS